MIDSFSHLPRPYGTVCVIFVGDVTEIDVYSHTASNLCLLLQKEQNVKGGEGPSGKQAVGINNGTR